MTKVGFDQDPPPLVDRTKRYWLSNIPGASQRDWFCSFSNATLTVPSGLTVGTENWFSSHSPAGPLTWNVQSAGFEPEISCGSDQLAPPLSLCDSKIAEEAETPSCDSSLDQGG